MFRKSNRIAFLHFQLVGNNFVSIFFRYGLSLSLIDVVIFELESTFQKETCTFQVSFESMDVASSSKHTTSYQEVQQRIHSDTGSVH